MALHGALLAADGDRQRPGVLVSVRGVRLAVTRLDDIDGALDVHAERLAGDAQQVLYAFRVADERGATLAEGRATVLLGPRGEA
jgi:predicted hotdog family 3-hydroxylacyl-ACP dehydratase